MKQHSPYLNHIFNMSNTTGATSGATTDYLRNKSWKPECVGSFNMHWRKFVFYPEPEAMDKNVINIYVFRKCRTQFMLTMEKSVTFTGACANEIISSINCSYFNKAIEGGHVRILVLIAFVVLIL